MSIVSFNNQQQGVQDLLAALPAPKDSPIYLWSEEDTGADAKSGFEDFLRDSTQSQQPAVREETPDTVDAPLRDDVQQGDQALADKPDEGDVESQPNDSAEDSAQDNSESTEAKKDGEQSTTQNSGDQSEENADAAQLQAAANAASAQLNVVDAVSSDQPKVQAQANATQQLANDQTKQVDADEKASSGKQSAANNLSLNAALPNQSQANTGQAAQVNASATTQSTLQSGEQSQANSGDTRGDSKAATASTTATTSASTNSNNAVATAAFTVADQASSETRLPLSTTATTQSADAARQVQSQAGLNTGDNDSLNAARLTRGLANAVQQRGGAVTLRLTPPEMGTVRIQMQITGTNVSASFHAESASAQTLLTTQLAQLRSSLESKGMSVERLSVQPLAATASSQNTNQSQNQSDTQQQSQSQQQSAGDGRSRGQYSGSSGGDSADQQQDNGSASQTRQGFFDRLSDATEQEAA